MFLKQRIAAGFEPSETTSILVCGQVVVASGFGEAFRVGLMTVVTNKK
jgi:hypothetical protein